MTCTRVHCYWAPLWESDPNFRHWNVAVGMSQLILRTVESCCVHSQWGLWWDSRGEKGPRNAPYTESIQISKFQLCFPHKKTCWELPTPHPWKEKQSFIHLVLPRMDVTGNSDVESTLEWNSSPYITRKFVLKWQTMRSWKLKYVGCLSSLVTEFTLWGGRKKIRRERNIISCCCTFTNSWQVLKCQKFIPKGFIHHVTTAHSV